MAIAPELILQLIKVKMDFSKISNWNHMCNQSSIFQLSWRFTW